MTIAKFPDPAITVNGRTEAHLRASLQRAGVLLSSAVTWGEFKEAGDLLLRDSDPLASVEFGVALNGDGRLGAETDEYGIWHLKEGR